MQEKGKNKALLVVCLFLPLIFGMSPVDMKPPEMNPPERNLPERKPLEKIRDPFRSPFATELMQAPETPSKPILNYDLSELKLVGIIWGELGRVAVVEAPDGKCYLVKKNGEIGKLKGKVKEVGEDHLEVQATVTDYLGRIKTEEITVRLHKEEIPVPN